MRAERIRSVVITTGVAVIATLAAWAAPAAADDPSKASNGDWITVSGQVVSTTDDSFRLDYGPGVITVEMDDWDWYHEGRKLLENDNVRVYDRLDKDAYESRKIEAGSVYVQDLGTYFFANAADEEDIALWTLTTPIHVGDIEISGKVDQINGRELVLTSGARIDTSELGYNPVDDKGFQRIDVGDRIKAGGHLDHDLFDTKSEIDATWIVSLNSKADGGKS